MPLPVTLASAPAPALPTMAHLADALTGAPARLVAALAGLPPALVDAAPGSLHALQTVWPPREWLVLGVLVLLQRLVARLGLWPYALVALPGTVLHELAHWVTAWLLGAGPSAPQLWPRQQAGRWQLGAVKFRPRRGTCWLIAIAPLALAPLAAGLARSGLAGAALDGRYALMAWVTAATLNAAWPSREDWRLAAPGLLTLAGSAALLVGAAWGWVRYGAG